MSYITTKQFCDGLRKEAERLASGEKEVSVIELIQIECWLDENDREKINQSYIRTIMNRHPAIKEIGTVKVKKFDGSDGDVPRYEITLNREPNRIVYTKDDIPALQKKAVDKAIKSIMDISPSFAHLDDEQIIVAVKAVEQYKDLIRKVFNIEGE